MFTDQIVREAWEAIKAKDTDRALNYFSENAVALGGILPDTLPISVAFHVMRNLWTALPDFHIASEAFEVVGDTVSITFCWGGTHTGVFALGIPGIPGILPTCKTVLVVDRFDFIVEGDEIILLSINSPENGGMPAALRQIGSMTAVTKP